MSKRKVVNPIVVIESDSARLKRLGDGKLDLMHSIRESTDNGRDLISFLVNLVKDGDKDSTRLKAVELLLSYGFGKPIETSVEAKVQQSGTSVNNLSDAQLEALIGTKSAAPAQLESDAEFEEHDDVRSSDD